MLKRASLVALAKSIIIFVGGSCCQIVNWDWMNKVEKLMLKVKKGALLGYNSDKVTRPWNSNTKQTKWQWKTQRWVKIVTVTKIRAKTCTIVKNTNKEIKQFLLNGQNERFWNSEIIHVGLKNMYPIPSHKRASKTETGQKTQFCTR